MPSVCSALGYATMSGCCLLSADHVLKDYAGILGVTFFACGNFFLLVSSARRRWRILPDEFQRFFQSDRQALFSSSKVLSWQFTPGISSIHPIHQPPAFFITAVYTLFMGNLDRACDWPAGRMGGVSSDTAVGDGTPDRRMTARPVPCLDSRFVRGPEPTEQSPLTHGPVWRPRWPGRHRTTCGCCP